MRRRFALPPAIAQQRFGLGFTGLLSLASAEVSGLLAREHATFGGAICGAGHIPHCGWCAGAVGFVLAGLTALIAAAGPALPKLAPAGESQAKQ